ncbi:MAG TPA: hypothetical protein DGO89_21810, partial [Microcoleaceae bacterium UBA9251]|nr:hypothetical protein [Microcoleaceae cyanobacterium UBA9251]
GFFPESIGDHQKSDKNPVSESLDCAQETGFFPKSIGDNQKSDKNPVSEPSTVPKKPGFCLNLSVTTKYFGKTRFLSPSIPPSDN